jgi:hypothetical protein
VSDGRVRGSLVLTLLAGLGCGTAAPPPPSTGAPPAATAATPAPGSPLPPEAQTAIDRALAVGREIYIQDVMSAWGTDVLREHVPGLEGVGGYLTLAEGNDDGTLKGTWLVQFFSREPTPRVLYRIRLWKDRSQQPAFEKLAPPAALTASEQVIIGARQAAIQAIPPPSQPINPVVLPAQILGEKGSLVYLLAGTTKADVAVLGKHHRVLVGEDGRVQKIEPLSKSVIEIPRKPPPGAQEAGLMVTHIVSDYPLETHVFAALLYRQPFYVGTRTGIWRVTGKEIVLIDAKGL